MIAKLEVLVKEGNELVGSYALRQHCSERLGPDETDELCRQWKLHTY